MIVEYTACLMNYNQTERIKKSVEHWFRIDNPPKEIIILDDGSTDGIEEIEIENVCVHIFKHSGNTCHMRNYAVDHLIETDWFILTEVNIIPYKDTITKIMERTKDENMIVCGWSLDMPDIIFPRIRIPEYHFDTHSFWNPDLTLWHKSTFPFYNEVYAGWSAEDNDLMVRFLIGKHRIFFCTTAKFIHLEHGKNKEFMEKGKNNGPMLRKAINEYVEKRITRLDQPDHRYVL